MSSSLFDNPANNDPNYTNPKRPIEYSWHLHSNSIGIPPYNTVKSNQGEITSTSFIPKKPTATPTLAPVNLTTPNRENEDNNQNKDVHASENTCNNKVRCHDKGASCAPVQKPVERPSYSCNMNNCAPSDCRPSNQKPAMNCPTNNRQPMERPSSNCAHTRKVPPSVLDAPVGIPAMPLYGYDNCEDAEKDCDYMKQMYPITAKKVMREVNEECDKLEYEGSCMFDEYPDRVYLERIVEKIYVRCSYLEENPVEVPIYNMPENSYMDETEIELIPYEYVSYRHPTHSPVQSMQYNPYKRPNKHHGPYRPGPQKPSKQQNPWLRNLIEILLYNEMLNRRRRYRGRKSWY